MESSDVVDTEDVFVPVGVRLFSVKVNAFDLSIDVALDQLGDDATAAAGSHQSDDHRQQAFAPRAGIWVFDELDHEGLGAIESKVGFCVDVQRLCLSPDVKLSP